MTHRAIVDRLTAEIRRLRQENANLALQLEDALGREEQAQERLEETYRRSYQEHRAAEQERQDLEAERDRAQEELRDTKRRHRWEGGC